MSVDNPECVVALKQAIYTAKSCREAAEEAVEDMETQIDESLFKTNQEIISCAESVLSLTKELEKAVQDKTERWHSICREYEKVSGYLKVSVAANALFTGAFLIFLANFKIW